LITLQHGDHVQSAWIVDTEVKHAHETTAGA
jgi:hypothetical protein